MRRREKQDEESREVWRDFERTTPIADPEPPAERSDVEKAVPEELTTADS